MTCTPSVQVLVLVQTGRAAKIESCALILTEQCHGESYISSYLQQLFGFGANGSVIHPEQHMSCLFLNSHYKYLKNI